MSWEGVRVRDRPVIGISAYGERAKWGVWHVDAVLLPRSYVDAVVASGGLPVVLPPLYPDGAAAADVVARLDGLVIAGGADVEPARYGAAPDAMTGGVRPDRDGSELALLDAAAAGDLPVLGVCRGMQLMAVAAGGTLHQHMPNAFGHDKHRPAPGVYGSHGARFEPGSRVAQVLGDAVTVNSYHHQGVDSPGSLMVTGWADDGSIESLEDPARRFALGVQWHPEVSDDHRLFAALVTASRDRSAA